MKKVLLGFLAAAALLVGGCRAYDDSALEERVKKLEDTVAGMSTLQSQIDALKAAAGATASGMYVKDVQEVKDGDTVIGFTVTFTDGKTEKVYTILNGKDGEDGEDGEDGDDGFDGDTPEISVEKVDGVYYWTVNGEFILDEDGNKVPTTGEAPVPQFKIDEGRWYYTIDNGATWVDCGPATIVNDYDDTIFSDVLDNTPEGYVTFVLADGVTTIIVPKETEFALVFPKYKEIGIEPGTTANLEYEVKGATEGTVVDAIAVSGGFEAEVKAIDYKSGVVAVTAPDPVLAGKVVVWADNGKGKTSIKALSFEGGITPTYVIELGDVTEVEPEGETIKVAVTSNMIYKVDIQENAKGWLRLVGTKAATTEHLEFEVDPNDTGEDRTGDVLIVGTDGTIYQTITFFQEAVPVPTLKEFATEFIKGLEVWENTVGNVDADGTHTHTNGTAWENVHFIPIGYHGNTDYGTEGNQYDPKYEVWKLNINGVEYSSAQAWEIAIRGLLDLVTEGGDEFLDTVTDRNDAYTLADNGKLSDFITPVDASHDWGKNPWYEYDYTVTDGEEEIEEVGVEFMVKVGIWHVVRSFIDNRSYGGSNSPLGAIGNFQEFGTTAGTLNLGNYVGYIAPMRELLVLMRIYKYILENDIEENVYTALKDQMFDFDLYGIADEPEPEGLLTRVWGKYHKTDASWFSALNTTRNDWNRNGTICGSYIYLPIVNNKAVGVFDLAGNYVTTIEGFAGGGTFTVDAIATLGDAVYVSSCGGNSTWVNGDLTIYKLTAPDANGMFTSFELKLAYPQASLEAASRFGDRMTAFGTDEDGVLIFVDYSSNTGGGTQCRANLQFHVENGEVSEEPVRASYLVTAEGSPMAGIYILSGGPGASQYALYASNHADTRAVSLDTWLGNSGWWNYGVMPNGCYGELPAFTTNVLDPRLFSANGKDYLAYVVASSTGEGVAAYLNVLELPDGDNILDRIGSITDVDAVSTKYGITDPDDPDARTGLAGSNSTGYCEISVVDGVTYILAGADVAGMSLFCVGNPPAPVTGSVTGPGNATVVPGGDF